MISLCVIASLQIGVEEISRAYLKDYSLFMDYASFITCSRTVEPYNTYKFHWNFLKEIQTSYCV